MARVVIMGVAGAGKTTVGHLASEMLGFPFLDADDLHSPADRASMAIGEPLDDHRRDLWIDRVRGAMGQHSDVVVACSALRRRHREQLGMAGPVMFFLDVPAEELARRLDERNAHFFPASLLASQIAALDPVEPDEGVIVLDGAQPAAVLADAIATAVRRPRIAHSDP
jgi:gluconokinase